MHLSLVSALLSTLILIPVLSQKSTRNIWEDQYKRRSAAEMAAQFESDGRAVYRHRRDIVALLELRPGQHVAEIGAGSGFLSRLAAAEVGGTGRVVATELDPKMVDYMNERARRDGLPQLGAIQGQVDRTGLSPASADAILIVNTYSFFDRPAVMMKSVVEGLKRGGLLVVVDFPRSDEGGVSPEQVKAEGTAAGLQFVDVSSIVPEHFALRFRKP